jgi:hypothetical protein
VSAMAATGEVDGACQWTGARLFILSGYTSVDALTCCHHIIIGRFLVYTVSF